MPSATDSTSPSPAAIPPPAFSRFFARDATTPDSPLAALPGAAVKGCIAAGAETLMRDTEPEKTLHELELNTLFQKL